MFHIVSFLETNEVEVVPTGWVDGDQCVWPTLKGDSLTKAVKMNMKPKKDWKKYKVKLLYTTDNYEDARRKLPEAEMFTDIQSDAEGDGKKPRRVMKSLRLRDFKLLSNSDSDEDDRQNLTVLEPPPPIQPPTFQMTQSISSPSTPQHQPSVYQPPSASWSSKSQQSSLYQPDTQPSASQQQSLFQPASQPLTDQQPTLYQPVSHPSTSPQQSLYQPASHSSTSPQQSLYQPASHPSLSPQQSLYQPASQPSLSPQQSLYQPASQPSLSPQQSLYQPASQPSLSPQQSLYQPASQPSLSPQQSFYQPASQPSTSPQQSFYQPTSQPSRSGQQSLFQPASQPSPSPQQSLYQPASQPSMSPQQSFYQPAIQPSKNRQKSLYQQASQPSSRQTPFSHSASRTLRQHLTFHQPAIQASPSQQPFLYQPTSQPSLESHQTSHAQSQSPTEMDPVGPESVLRAIQPLQIMLKEILTKQEMVLDQQKTILRILHSTNRPNSDVHDGATFKNHLPVKDTESLQCLEAELKTNTNIKSELINYLGLIGGVDVRDTVWRVLKATFSTTVARGMNWRGVNGKVCFQRLVLKEVVIGAVRQNPQTRASTQKEIELTIIKWLHLAGDRDGGRRERMKRPLATQVQVQE
nr:transcription factor SPT20 homolog isoform X2 [Misgurnus anguillicaudatus]